nr:right-handed parallel beta-helix repeat-containing protein [Bacteroidota bacterium]
TWTDAVGSSCGEIPGSSSTTKPQIQLNFICSPCVSPPTAGTAVASSANVCAGQNVTVSLSGNTFGSGMSYQWESSSNNTSWTTIPGATAANFTTQMPFSVYFRCILTCTNIPDTSTSVFVNVPSVPLSGIYTINSAMPTSGTNFQTLEDFTNLISCVGVSGPVTANMATGSGPYTSGLVIGSISGSSAVNTVTINGNGNVVNEGSGNHFLTFNGSSYVTIDSTQFINTTPATGMFGIIITGGSQHINITNNTIDVGDNTLFASGGIVISGSVTSGTTAGNNGNYINISNNEIIGGYYGITLNGSASYLNCVGNNVSNNIVRDFYLYGIYLNNVDTATIANNDISRMNRSSLSTFYGIYLSTSRNVKVLKNNIHDSGVGTYTAYPVYVTNSINTLGYETEFINNAVFNIHTTGTKYAFYVLGTRDYMNFYHNTIILEGTGGLARGFFSSTAPNNHKFQNNIISISGSSTSAKYCIYISATSTSFTSNNNVLHMGATAGTNYIGYWGGNQEFLSNWQFSSSQDANSVNMDPVFSNLSGGNITPLSISVDNIGAPLGITTDLNNAARSATTPDAGAIEFTGLIGDIGLIDGMLDRNNICYNANDTVVLTIKNLFGATVDFSVNPLTAVWAVSGPVNSTGTIVLNTGSLAVGATMEMKSFSANMTLPGIYTLTAHIQPNLANLSATNDTLVTPFTSEVKPILAITPQTTTITSPYATQELNANSPLFPGGAVKFSELVHFKSSTGAPTGGWPAWVADDDNLEIIGVPNASIAGYIIETWQTNAATVERVHTFPAGAVMSPNGTAYLGWGGTTGGMDLVNFYYRAGFSANLYGSNSQIGYVLKDQNGNIIDVAVYGNVFTWSAASGVAASDWSGTNSISGSGTSGFRRIGATDTNSAADWVITGGTVIQDPNIYNPGVNPMIPGNLTGLNWYYNSNIIATDTTSYFAGPYTASGTYTYSATYTTVCGTYSDTAVIMVNLTTAALSATDVNCFGNADGEATATSTGGDAPYTYEWAHGPTTATVTGLVAGTYVVTVKDANNWPSMDSIVIAQPDDIIAAMTSVPYTCATGMGSLTANISGGTPVYQYLWQNGDTTETSGNLAAGVYTVTVTDANNCVAMLSDTVFESLLLPGALNLMDVTCFGGNNGEATLSATGGLAPYTYEWSDMQTGDTATGLIAGMYTVTVTDANLCASTDTVNIEEPTKIITMASNIVNVNCFGGNDGSVTIIATGGVPPYNFTWLTGQTGDVISGLEAGTYTVTVTDINLCDVMETALITEPSQMDTTVAVAGITLTANITGTATFQWFNCGGSDIPQATGISYTPTANGAYAVRITSDGCTDES